MPIPDRAAAGDRLDGLDVLRGVAVIAMMMVDWPGSWELPRLWLFEHARWVGVTPADFIFPTFLVAMGVAVPLALARRPAIDTGGVLPRMLRRGAVFVAVGLALNLLCALPGPIDVSKLRIPGVLQRYGLIYPAVAWLYLRLPVRALSPLAVALLLVYWALLTLVPVPGFGPPDLSRFPAGEVTPNLAAWLDKAVLHHHVYEYPFDPEGILSTLPSLSSALLGVWAGQELLATERSLAARIRRLAAAGIALVAVGLGWALDFPLCKKIWSGSFAVLSGGVVLLLLAAALAVFDLRLRNRGRLAIARWYGRNAFAAIALFTTIDCATTIVPVGHDGSGATISLKAFLFDHLFRSWLPDRHASWVYSAVAIVLLSLLFRWFDRRRIYFRA